MKFDDLKVEPIKTLMATQRILLTKYGYAISFMGDEQDLTSGDGVNTFEIKVFKHNLDTTNDVDFFNSDINPNIINFEKTLLTLNCVSRKEVDDFFNTFVV